MTILFKRSSIFNIFLLLALASVFSLSSCSKKKYLNDGAEVTGAYEVSDEDIQAGNVSSDLNNAFGLQTVFFPFDSHEITGAAEEVLKENYDILANNLGITVQIEGHCDERGGIQYNLALGEKRAGVLKRKLVFMGISNSRVSTVSYGKERPLVEGNGEFSWSKNRRGNFVVTGK